MQPERAKQPINAQYLLSLGIVLGVVLMALVVFLLKGHVGGQRSYVTAQQGRSETGAGDWALSSVVRDPRFAMIVPGLLAPAFITAGFSFHQARLVETKGWSLTWWTGTFVVYDVSTMCASLMAGPVVDPLGALQVMPSTCCLWPGSIR